MPPSAINQQRRWHGCNTTAELEQAVVRAVLDAARQAIAQRSGFHIVLTGGKTPRRMYEMLCAADTDWRGWHVYFGDERCLPRTDAERNSLMAELAWLNHVPIPASQIHPIPAESGAAAAAKAYMQVLAGVSLFDMVLLGLGEDGHVASLFPGHTLGDSPASPAVIAVHDAPKPPPARVSLSAWRLSATRQLLFLVSGMAKHQAVRDWRNGAPLPAACITPANGVDIYLEAGLLRPLSPDILASS